jgi:Mg2+ and Co2+ transporter CorA
VYKRQGDDFFTLDNHVDNALDELDSANDEINDLEAYVEENKSAVDAMEEVLPLVTHIMSLQDQITGRDPVSELARKDILDIIPRLIATLAHASGAASTTTLNQNVLGV